MYDIEHFHDVALLCIIVSQQCGPRRNHVDITDSDTSLCESVPQVAVSLRSHCVRGHLKLGATSSKKGYARGFYRAALLRGTRIEMLVRPHNRAISSFRRTLGRHASRPARAMVPK